MLWVVLAGMTGLAALAAVWPLVRGARRGAPPSADAAFYKAQLGEIERDVARGFLPADEAAGARVEAARRLIAASAATAGGADRRRAGTAARAGAIADLRRRAGRRAWRSTPSSVGPTYPTRRSPRARSTRAACRGSKRRSRMSSSSLAASPDNGPAWALVAPVYMRLGRFDDAVNAYRQSLRLNGENARSARDYGEALVGAAGGVVTADARAAFDKALAEQPGLPAARFYLGLAAEQDGDKPKAIADLSRAARPKRRRRRPGAGARRRGWRRSRASGPVHAGERRGAAAGAARQQEAMIRGMVERLATRLATSGGDADEWQRLIRAYTVLHEPDKAKDALASARKALAGDAEAGQQLDALARELGIGG